MHSLVPMPFLKQAWTSGSSWFTYYWSLAWRILSITFLAWDECNCAVVWAFLDIVFLWDWNENWPFPVLWPLLSFPNLLNIECSSFTASSFRIWNSSTGIPSPPLALFVVMLSKAHLTSHSRMSGSRWVCDHTIMIILVVEIFLYCSSVYTCYLFLISSAPVRFIPFLSFIKPIFAWNVPLVSLIFLKRSFPFCCFPLFLFTDHWGRLEIYTKGIFQAKMGLIKDRNGMNLTEVEDIKKR